MPKKLVGVRAKALARPGPQMADAPYYLDPGTPAYAKPRGGYSPPDRHSAWRAREEARRAREEATEQQRRDKLLAMREAAVRRAEQRRAEMPLPTPVRVARGETDRGAREAAAGQNRRASAAEDAEDRRRSAARQLVSNQKRAERDKAREAAKRAAKRRRAERQAKREAANERDKQAYASLTARRLPVISPGRSASHATATDTLGHTHDGTYGASASATHAGAERATHSDGGADGDDAAVTDRRRRRRARRRDQRDARDGGDGGPGERTGRTSGTTATRTRVQALIERTRRSEQRTSRRLRKAVDAMRHKRSQRAARATRRAAERAELLADDVADYVAPVRHETGPLAVYNRKHVPGYTGAVTHRLPWEKTETPDELVKVQEEISRTLAQGYGVTRYEAALKQRDRRPFKSRVPLDRDGAPSPLVRAEESGRVQAQRRAQHSPEKAFANRTSSVVAHKEALIRTKHAGREGGASNSKA